ncbi:MAG: glycogen debranching protein [Clostridium sp.]|nr:glycogen debranching protein [Clostridium sp.]
MIKENNMNYLANGGQTYMPFQHNIKVKTVDYVPLSKPEPAIDELVLNETAIKKGWIIQSQEQHFVPGVTSEMMDWFWANMEKCYYLWAPGSHKRFNWVKEPWKYGFVNSIHMISESVGENCPVFGGSGIEIHRLPLTYFPFTTNLEHVICEGTFNDKGEFVDSTIHMWDDVEGGCRHITAAVVSTKATEPPHFVLEMLAENPEAKIVPPSVTNHAEYEASMWPRFLPQIYSLWKDHPDKTQSVECNLTVRKLEDGSLEYVYENGPVEL